MLCFLGMLDPHGLISNISFFIYTNMNKVMFMYMDTSCNAHNIRRHHSMLSYMVTYCTFFFAHHMHRHHIPMYMDTYYTSCYDHQIRGQLSHILLCLSHTLKSRYAYARGCMSFMVKKYIDIILCVHKYT